MAQTITTAELFGGETISTEDLFMSSEDLFGEVKPLPEPPPMVEVPESNLLDAAKYVGVESGKDLLHHGAVAAETSMSLASGMVLWPFSKAYGTMALPFSAEAAEIAESEIASLGYQPYTKESQQIMGLIGKGMDMFLAPAHKAKKMLKKYPRLAYLVSFGIEVAEFAVGAKAIKGVKGKPKIETAKARPIDPVEAQKALVEFDEFLNQKDIIKARQVKEMAITKKPLDTLARKEETLAAEAPRLEKKAELTKTFTEIPEEPMARVPKEHEKAPEIVSTEELFEPTFLDKATERLGGKEEPLGPKVTKEQVELGDRVTKATEKRVKPVKVFRIKEKLPLAEKRKAEKYVNARLKEGRPAKEIAERFDKFLRDNQSLKGKEGLRKKLLAEVEAFVELKGGKRVAPARTTAKLKEPWEMTKDEFSKQKDILHHGTPFEFDKFDLNKMRGGLNAWSGEGVNFTTDKPAAFEWAKERMNAEDFDIGEHPTAKPKVISVKADLKNTLDPFNNEKHHKLFYSKSGQQLTEMGFDSIKTENAVVVLDVSKIKTHKDIVKQAIKEGRIKSHPDYPDLKPTPKPKAPKAEAPDLGGKRTIIDTAKDINKAVGKRGELGTEKFTKEQKEAWKRVKGDAHIFMKSAEKTGKSVEQYLLDLGMDAKVVRLVKKRADEIKLGLEKVKPVTEKEILDAKKKGARVMDMIKDRGAEIDKATLDSEVFIREIVRKLTPEERESLPFLIERIKDPNVLKKVGKENLIETIKNPSSALKAEVKKIREYLNESHEFLKENYGDVEYVENYITHIWDLPRKGKGKAGNYFTTTNPFTKKRYIPSLEEGIKEGYIPKTTDVAAILRAYDRYKIHAVHNKRFVDQLDTMVTPEGNPVIMAANKAPSDWVAIDHPALFRTRRWYDPKTRTHGQEKVSIKIDPEMASEVKIIFDKPFSNAAVTAWETVGAYQKKSMLSLSFFHHHALTEVGFGAGVGKKTLGLWNPKKIYNALKKGDYAIYDNIELTKDAIDAGVKFGEIADVQRGRIVRHLEALERKTKNVPGVNKATKGLRTANELWDKALWDHLHNGIKLYAYESMVLDALKKASKKAKRALTPEETQAIKNEIGKFTNDIAGGQNWELSKVFGNPKHQQMMQWAFLAPDWLVSTIKQATAPVRGSIIYVKGRARGDALAQMKGAALVRQGSLFWARSMFYFNTIAQSMNYYNTKRDKGEGRFTWENPPGNRLNIYIGSGYPMEWQNKPLWDWEAAKARGVDLLTAPVPFSLRSFGDKTKPGTFMFTFPTTRGMSPYKTRELFKEAIKAKDKEKIKAVFVWAAENGIDGMKQFKTAKSKLKSDITFDNKTVARDIFLEIRALKGDAKKDAFNIYKERGVLTPGVVKELNKVAEERRNVTLQKLLLGVKGK